MKELYARDILTAKEYEILHKHFANDEAYRIDDGREELIFHNSVINKAHEVASRILSSESLEQLVEYDLYHVLSYNEDLEYIIEKIEKAIDNG